MPTNGRPVWPEQIFRLKLRTMKPCEHGGFVVKQLTPTEIDWASHAERGMVALRARVLCSKGHNHPVGVLLPLEECEELQANAN